MCVANRARVMRSLPGTAGSNRRNGHGRGTIVSKGTGTPYLKPKIVTTTSSLSSLSLPTTTAPPTAAAKRAVVAVSPTLRPRSNIVSGNSCAGSSDFSIGKSSSTATTTTNNSTRSSKEVIVQHNYHDHANDDPMKSILLTPSEYQTYTASSSSSDGDQYSNQDQNHHCLLPRRPGRLEEPFPTKLYHMLNKIEKDGLSDIISWQPHGRCFVIHKPAEFKQVVLPKYFMKVTKMTSFQRQLNLYGFLRITKKGPDRGGYYHELFLRGKLWLTHHIQRIRVKGTGVRGKSNPNQEPNFYQMKWMTTVIDNNNCNDPNGTNSHAVDHDDIFRCQEQMQPSSSSSSSTPMICNSSIRCIHDLTPEAIFDDDHDSYSYEENPFDHNCSDDRGATTTTTMQDDDENCTPLEAFSNKNENIGSNMGIADANMIMNAAIQLLPNTVTSAPMAYTDGMQKQLLSSSSLWPPSFVKPQTPPPPSSSTTTDDCLVDDGDDRIAKDTSACCEEEEVLLLPLLPSSSSVLRSGTTTERSHHRHYHHQQNHRQQQEHCDHDKTVGTIKSIWGMPFQYMESSSSCSQKEVPPKVQFLQQPQQNQQQHASTILGTPVTTSSDVAFSGNEWRSSSSGVSAVGDNSSRAVATSDTTATHPYYNNDHAPANDDINMEEEHEDDDDSLADLLAAVLDHKETIDFDNHDESDDLLLRRIFSV